MFKSRKAGSVAGPILAATLFVAPVLQAQEAVQPEEGYGRQHVETAIGQSSMVVAANPIAAKAGAEVLAQGGSAADAAVRLALTLNLVEPQSSGLGGGAFIVYHDASLKKLITIDAREAAPKSANAQYWLDENGEAVGWWQAVVGGRSVGVPGLAAGLKALQSEYGLKNWSDLVTPVAKLARDGFIVSPRMSNSIKTAEQRQLGAFEDAREYFFDAGGAPLEAGTLLKSPKLANTLDKLAALGPAAIMTGDIAQEIIEKTRTKTNSGELTLADLATYEAKNRKPICVDYRDYEVCGMGPPSSGALTVGEILGILDNFDMSDLGNSAKAWHLYAEASRLAYADRAKYMADSDFVRMPIKGLLDPSYLKSRAHLIDPMKAATQVTAGAPPWKEGNKLSPDTQYERPGTTHFVIRDAMGNIASVTASIETGFGSRLMAGGFLLNNELTDFSRAPTNAEGIPIANRVEGGKRPRSSMSPTIVFKDGVPVMALGSAGGSRIIHHVAATLVRVIDFGMTLDEALAAGQIMSLGGPVDIEEGTEAVAFAHDLKKLGHQVRVRPLNSGLTALMITDDGIIGAADPRREGIAIGD